MQEFSFAGGFVTLSLSITRSLYVHVSLFSYYGKACDGTAHGIQGVLSGA